MNQTEANAAVLKAAKLFLERVPGAVVGVESLGPQKLAIAIRKVEPRVMKMKQRLIEGRARRKGKKAWVPPFLERAIENE
jgi:hypothetical protein